MLVAGAVLHKVLNVNKQLNKIRRVIKQNTKNANIHNISVF